MGLPIAQLGQPVLRRPADPVTREELASPEFQTLLANMAETMAEAGGVGLAAPQVFVSKRLFLARIIPGATDDDDPTIECFVNPTIVAASTETASAWEGCLSFQELMVLVPRRRRVVIEYWNAAGAPCRLDLVDFPARVVQHESDHLDGILTLDRAASTRDIAKASEMETVRAARRAAAGLPPEPEDDDA